MSLKNSSDDTGPQALNNSCRHDIRKLQILCFSIVSERVCDSTEAYRPIYRVGHLTFWIWIGYKKKLMDIFSKVWFYEKDWTFPFKNETQHHSNDCHGRPYSTPFDQPNFSVHFRLFLLQSHEVYSLWVN